MNYFRLALIAFSMAAAQLLAAQDDVEPDELFTGDLDGIKRRGELRVLVTGTPDLDEIPRRISPRSYDRIFLSDIAESQGLVLKYVCVEKFTDLIPALNEGRGDIIADNISITREHRKFLDYTVPLSSVQDQIVAAKNNDAVRNEADLAGKTIYVEAGTTYVNSLNQPGVQKDLLQCRLQPLFQILRRGQCPFRKLQPGGASRLRL